MTSAFESAFINHLREKKRGDPWFRRRHEKFGAKKVKEDSNLLVAHRMVLKKYRKQWQSYRSVRKKILIEHLKNAVSTESKSKIKYRTLSDRHSWPSFNSGVNGDSLFTASKHSQSLIFGKRHTIDTSDLQSVSFCTDFPISEIETELSGNRGNGNSPFNSSNSCGSPEGLNLDPQSVQNVKQSSDVKIMNQNNQKKCLNCSLDIEPNNNSELANICSCNKKNDLEGDGMYKETNISNSSEDYIDVVSVDNDDEFSEVKGASEKVEGNLDDKSVQLYININERCESPVMFVGSNSSRNALKPPPISPVKWQQQFMSFLSTSSSTVSNQDQLENANIVCNDFSVSSHSHSSRRKRSRKVRSSTCPCCLGLSSHKRRQKHYSTDGKHSHHSKKLSREQRHFIRDMMQLVSLRNRIVQLLCVLLPECKDQLSDINPDTDGVEKCIDQIIFILKSGSPSFHDDTQESFHRVIQDKTSNSAAQENDLDSVFDVSECPSLIKSPDISQSEFNSAYGEETDDEDMPVLDHFMSVDEQSSQHKMPTNLSEENQCNFRASSTCREPWNSEAISRLQIISDADSGIVHDDEMNENISLDFTRTSLKSENGKYSFERGKTLKPETCDDQKVCDSVIVNSAGTETKLFTELSTDNCNELVNPYERYPSNLMTKQRDDMETDDKDVNSSCVHSSASVIQEIKSLDDDNNNNDGSCKLESENGKYQDTDGLLVGLPSSENMNTEASCHSKNRSDPFINQEFALNYSSKEEQKESSLNQLGCNLLKDVHSDDSTSANRAVLCNNSDPATADKYMCHDIAPETGNDTSVTAVVPSVIAVYDPQIIVCKKPKICLKAFKKRVYRLLHWLLPELTLESNFFKSTDNLEFLLDTIIVSNQGHLNADH